MIDHERSAEEKVEVLLVAMPFGGLSYPSIGLSLLRASLKPIGIRSKILYFTFLFAKSIGVKSYQQFSDVTKSDDCYKLAGEWTFASELFAESVSTDNAYVDAILRARFFADRSFKIRPDSEKFISGTLKAKEKTGAFLDKCLSVVQEYHPRIVGFTSVYQQQTASLALAKRIKTLRPEIVIVFGGPNCEQIMGAELLRQFPFIDAVVSGEGDVVFPELVRRVLKGKPISDIQGVYPQGGHLPERMHCLTPNTPLVRDMDRLPCPDYDDYFEQLSQSHITLTDDPFIPMELSRGCWWGEKGRCTFCGVNGSVLNYRSKSGARALEEMTALIDKYRGMRIQIVDNVLGMDYLTNLIPKLVDRELGAEIFFEVRSTLKKEHVRALRDAGTRCFQPGIESLSTPMLKLMRKGVSGLQNLAFLKWCKELGVLPVWNLLWGFPGEPREEYARMADLVPLITHLNPPDCYGRIYLCRFSPNFEEAEKLGFAHVSPTPALHYIYPFDSQAVANLAYYFTYDYRHPQNVESYTNSLAKEIKKWKRTHAACDLFSIDHGERLLIWESRSSVSEPLTMLSGIQKSLYEACDNPQSLSRLKKTAQIDTSNDYSSDEIEMLLSDILKKGLMVRDGNDFLSLAIPVGEYQPGKEALEDFHAYMRKKEEMGKHLDFMEKVIMTPISEDLTISREEIEALRQ